jgi:hypothetical protein
MIKPPTQLVNTLTSSPIGSGCNESKVLKGPGAMPIHTLSQQAVFSMGRNAYTRTTSQYRFQNGKAQPAYILKPLYSSMNHKQKQTGKPIQSSASYSASSHIEAKKRNVIGQGSRVTGTNDELAFMKGDRNVVNSSLAKVRNIGAAAGKKRGFFAANKNKYSHFF